MKVIDLLNKIANGEEVPKKIKYNETLFSYDEGIDYKTQFGNFLMGGRVCICSEDLNDELEIIEENPTLNDIRESYGLPRIEEHKIPEKFEIYDNSIEWCCNGRSITDNEKDIMDKINEILDYLEVNND